MVKAIINEYTENTYIINEKKEAFIIDPGAHFKEIVNYVNESELIVNGVLLTHGHFDHLYTLNKIIDEYKCNVYIFNKERDFLFDPSLNLSNSINSPFILKDKSKVVELNSDSVIEFGREKITLLHTPGHTRGGVCYRYKRFLFSGDTLFKGTIGRADLPTSNKADLKRSLELIVKHCRDNTVVYPGHGNFTTILSEKRDNPYLDFMRRK
jgi:glyoxylase-like metal-dependent hydrolase (beta-lactamase superfamily II)